MASHHDWSLSPENVDLPGVRTPARTAAAVCRDGHGTAPGHGITGYTRDHFAASRGRGRYLYDAALSTATMLGYEHVLAAPHPSEHAVVDVGDGPHDSGTWLGPYAGALRMAAAVVYVDMGDLVVEL